MVKVVTLNNFPKQNNIFPSYNENAPRNVSVLLAHMNSLDGPVQNQIGELVDASQVPYQSPAVPQQHHKFFWNENGFRYGFDDTGENCLLSNSSRRCAVPSSSGLFILGTKILPLKLNIKNVMFWKT